MRAQAALSAAVLAGGVGAAIAGSGSAGLTLAGPEVLRLVRDAPAALSSYPALRVHGTMTFSFSGHTVRESLDSVATPDGHSASMTVDLPSLHKRVTMTAADGRLYVEVPGADLPGGAHYASCQLPAGSGGFGAANPTGGDPLGYLRLMPGATGDVKVIGHQTIDGVRTTEYEVHIDLAMALQKAQSEGRSTAVSAQQLQQLGLSTMPYQVWIDDQKAIRQFGFEVTSHGFAMKTRLRISGTTNQPTVSAPPANDVFITDCPSLGRLSIQ